MKTILHNEIIIGAMQRVKSWANRGLWNGKEQTQYFQDCIWYIQKYDCSIIFTKDIGYHTGGWWKNPEYERCYHLSISFKGGKNKNGLDKILTGLFGANKNLLWIEPPYSKEGKSMEVWHYRLFCNVVWEPILPKGEVYNTHFTEKGWKSFSELKS